MAPGLRVNPTKKVQFDNSISTPNRRNQRLRTPRASQQASNAKGDADNDQDLAEDEIDAVDNEEDEDSTEESEPQINTLIELRRCVDNVKGSAISGSSIPMAAWEQPGNEIIEEQVELELDRIQGMNSRWTSRWLATNSGGWSCLTSTGNIRAEITARGVKEPYRFELDYEDPSGYITVYEMVRRMWQERAKNIRLTLIEHFAAKAATPPPTDKQQASQNESSSQGTKRRRETATDRQDRLKQVQRDADRVTGNFVSQIYQEWTCHDRNCLNWSKACYINRGEHLFLLTEDLTRWSSAIDSGNATVETAPEGLLAGLLYRKLKSSKPRLAGKREDELGKLPFVLNIGTPSPHPMAPGPESRSSPPHQEGRDLLNVSIYLNWLVSEGSITQEHADLAKEGLSSRGFGWNFLRSVEDGEWEEMGVPRGTRLAILKRQKAWQQHIVKERLIESRNKRSEVIWDISDEELL